MVAISWPKPDNRTDPIIQSNKSGLEPHVRENVILRKIGTVRSRLTTYIKEVAKLILADCKSCTDKSYWFSPTDYLETQHKK